MRNNLQPKCRMPWERAGVTLQGPGLSNCASLFNRLLCFSIHFIHYCAFLPPLHCWNRAAPTATFYCCTGRSRARCSGITAPHCCNSYCTSAQNKALCSLQLYSINGNDELQFHCDFCTVPISQPVVHAPPQSL